MMMKKLFLSLLVAGVLASCQKESSQGPDSNQPLSAKTELNTAYGTDAMQKMDLYLPAGRTDTTRVIVMVHGGAWVEGDKAEFTPYVSVLQQRFPGYAVANINYRLASVSGNYFPTQENDMKAAIKFLAENAASFHISQKMVLLGASAGGHMALLQAYKNSTPKIMAVVDFFGPTSMTQLYNDASNFQTATGIQILMQGTPASNPTAYQQSSPVSFVNAQTPPTIMLHGTADDVVKPSHSTNLSTQLTAAGVVNQLVTYTGRGHELWPADVMTDAFNKIEAFVKANAK